MSTERELTMVLRARDEASGAIDRAMTQASGRGGGWQTGAAQVGVKKAELELEAYTKRMMELGRAGNIPAAQAMMGKREAMQAALRSQREVAGGIGAMEKEAPLAEARLAAATATAMDRRRASAAAVNASLMATVAGDRAAMSAQHENRRRWAAADLALVETAGRDQSRRAVAADRTAAAQIAAGERVNRATEQSSYVQAAHYLKMIMRVHVFTQAFRILADVTTTALQAVAGRWEEAGKSFEKIPILGGVYAAGKMAWGEISGYAEMERIRQDMWKQQTASREVITEQDKAIRIIEETGLSGERQRRLMGLTGTAREGEVLEQETARAIAALDLTYKDAGPSEAVYAMFLAVRRGIQERRDQGLWELQQRDDAKLADERAIEAGDREKQGRKDAEERLHDWWKGYEPFGPAAKHVSVPHDLAAFESRFMQGPAGMGMGETVQKTSELTALEAMEAGIQRSNELLEMVRQAIAALTPPTPLEF